MSLLSVNEGVIIWTCVPCVVKNHTTEHYSWRNYKEHFQHNFHMFIVLFHQASTLCNWPHEFRWPLICYKIQ